MLQKGQFFIECPGQPTVLEMLLQDPVLAAARKLFGQALGRCPKEKLFKEYALADMSRYREGQVGLPQSEEEATKLARRAEQAATGRRKADAKAAKTAVSLSSLFGLDASSQGFPSSKSGAGKAPAKGPTSFAGIASGAS